MFIYDRSIRRAPLMGGAFIVLVAGCSKGPDRAAGDTTAAMTTATMTQESAASTVRVPADSPSARVDTPTAARAESATPAQTPAPKPRVKPSIDPGRKTTPPTTSTRAPVALPRDPANSSDSASAPAAPTDNAAGKDTTLKYDAGTNTVTFLLIGGPSGFQFNGHASGSATLTLPPKADVVINFVNKDGTPHSAEVISGEGPLPNSGVDAALPRAYTNQLLQGLPQEGGDAMRFQVPASGSYRVFCGVPGHGLSGMWIWMKVDPAAKTPSFGPTKG